MDDRSAARRAALEPWLFLASGLATAPLLTCAPVLHYMGWFLAALCHEMGHSTLACAFGMPAFPALGLDGHAASLHRDQIVVLALAAWGVLGWCAWQARARPRACGALAAAALLYPLLAFTSGKELVFLLAGHLGELAMATYCFVHVLDGGFTKSRLERALHGTLAWHLLGCNVLLCWGLATRAEARAAYGENGSFGLTNDYIRIAEDVLGWRLESVALAMLPLCFVPLALALALWWRSAAAPVDPPVDAVSPPHTDTRARFPPNGSPGTQRRPALRR